MEIEHQQPNDLIELTKKFVNSTTRHVFLTGKAGTGKTTFLRELAERTHKNFVIVAPTGIAALNAGGVTIHSQFLFPFGSFVPDKSPDGSFAKAGSDTRFFTQHTLARKHPLNSTRKQVLRAADLLIIDEVSMLRADLLDAIDYRMRSVKQNFQRSFGGVQVLFIGDLFQLPPIVNDNEWIVLSKYYKSMHFFEAHALKHEPAAYIELTKIFRQEDQQFIDLLNNLRNNAATQSDIETLNWYVKTEAEIDKIKGAITLTTHNRKADTINQNQLNKLSTKAFTYKAKVSREFPEHIFPVDAELTLKVGAQVMFIKNDTSAEKRFFNGKLAEVSSLSRDEIKVVFEGEKEEFTLDLHEWENKKYTVNPSNKELEEEVIGTFEQYPIKLAWAVTVHKSQGLTFDKAIIDVGQAFAAGQVYVALSRLRSLDGLILRSLLSSNVLFTDREVKGFVSDQNSSWELSNSLATEQQLYLERVLLNAFNFEPIEKAIGQQERSKKSTLEFDLESLRLALPAIKSHFETQQNTTRTFRGQLSRLLKEGDQKLLMQRLEKGSDYYLDFLTNVQKQVLEHLAEVEQLAKTKAYRSFIEELDQLVMKAIAQIEKAAMLAHCIHTQQEIPKESPYGKKRIDKRKAVLEAARQCANTNPDLQKTKTGKKRRKPLPVDGEKPKKVEKGSTYNETFKLLNSGLSLEEVAKKRGLVKSTIEGHVAKGIAAKKLKVEDFIEPKALEVLLLAIKKSTEGSAAIYAAFKGKYSYGQIRMVQASLD